MQLLSLAFSSIMRCLWKSLFIFLSLILLSSKMVRVTIRHYVGSLPGVILYFQEEISLTFGKKYSRYSYNPAKRSSVLQSERGSWADSVQISHRDDSLPKCSCPLSCLSFQVEGCNAMQKELAGLNIPEPQFYHFYMFSFLFIGCILAPGCCSLNLTVQKGC